MPLQSKVDVPHERFYYWIILDKKNSKSLQPHDAQLCNLKVYKFKTQSLKQEIGYLTYIF